MVGAGEQFGPVPGRAISDTRLSAVDFRVLIAVAYFDRFSRNGTGCFVALRRLAELTSIDYRHISRHTARLESFGYITSTPSPTDRRRRIYRVIYDRELDVIAGSRRGAARRRNSSKKVANTGEKLAQKDTTARSEPVDIKVELRPKRSRKTSRKKIEAPSVENHSEREEVLGSKANSAGQEGLERHWKSGTAATELRYKATDELEIDWPGWAEFLQSQREIENGMLFILDAIDDIKREFGGTDEDAWPILDAKLRKLRAQLRDGETPDFSLGLRKLQDR